ncbi:hypothetical protein B0T20DRAFT_256757 [Sordaria brevicollis]|uniref:Uncharacterized protein n=1 Tax=Sordaria brevicollis TaxID=83679 RepID=A0AAE0PCI6_SORBR|nr:hypothetical protein B0T20DRAFT_256757 [Sordaria brevicollis]
MLPSLRGVEGHLRHCSTNLRLNITIHLHCLSWRCLSWQRGAKIHFRELENRLPRNNLLVPPLHHWLILIWLAWSLFVVRVIHIAVAVAGLNFNDLRCHLSLLMCLLLQCAFASLPFCFAWFGQIHA